MDVVSVRAKSLWNQLPWLPRTSAAENVKLGDLPTTRLLHLLVPGISDRQETKRGLCILDEEEQGYVNWKNWKHGGPMVAAMVLSLSLSSPALSLEIQSELATQDLKACERIQDAPCDVSQLKFSKVEELHRSVKLGDMSAAVAISPAASASKVVHTAAAAVMPQAIHPVIVTSGSRIVARILQHLGGGGIAGAIGAALVYPLDTIKTRMQAESKPEDGEELHYKNEIDCFNKLVADEGMGSLYSGLIPQLLGVAPEKALKLTVNELLLEMLEHVMPGAGLWMLELIAGGGGGFSQVVFTNPVEIVKVRLQTQPNGSEKKDILAVVKELGLRGLYHGSGMTLARDIPSSGIFFACYAILRQLYPDQTFVDGFLAAIPATILSHPMDVVKTRLQMELPPGQTPYENALSCFKSVWQTEGPQALFKGSLARVLRTSPQFGITFLVYNFICGGS